MNLATLPSGAHARMQWRGIHRRGGLPASPICSVHNRELVAQNGAETPVLYSIVDIPFREHPRNGVISTSVFSWIGTSIGTRMGIGTSRVLAHVMKTFSCAFNLRDSARRARFRRDFTVPSGICITSDIS